MHTPEISRRYGTSTSRLGAGLAISRGVLVSCALGPLLISGCGGAPKSRFEVTVSSGATRDAQECAPTVAGEQPKVGCEPFEVTDASKIVVQPGESLTITGKHFRPTMTVAANEFSGSASGAKVSVLSDTSASLVVPAEASYGVVDVMLVQDGVKQKVTLLSNGGKTDYPVFTAGAEQICRGMKFYDGTGVLQEGTKDCSRPSECQANGVAGCVTTNTYKSADLTNLSAANIRQGVTVAGVVGTYPSAATPLATNTSATDLTTVGAETAAGTYEFFDSTGSVRSLIVADGGTVTPSSSLQAFSAAQTFYRAFKVEGVDGAPSTCSVDGGVGCLTTSAFKAADMGRVLAGNIRRNVTIAGVEGDYPSADHPLAEAWYR